LDFSSFSPTCLTNGKAGREREREETDTKKQVDVKWIIVI